MKNKLIARWILEQLLHVFFYVLGVVVCLFIYPFITAIATNKTPVLWWFLNDTTKRYKGDIDYGNYGRFKHNYIGFIQQCAFRNSHWNLRLKLRPKQGKLYDIQPKDSKLTFYNVTRPFILGVQPYLTYYVNGVKYFRISKTVKWFYNKRIFNYQFGYSNERAIFKIRNIKTS